jgi:hypothetical protein
MKRLVIGIALAACGTTNIDGAAEPPGGGSGSGIEPPSCAVQLKGPTTMPIASPIASVNVRALITQTPGTLKYQWTVVRDDGQAIRTTAQTNDGSAISFPIPVAGVYDVRFDAIGSLISCPTVTQTINVGVANARRAAYRIRVVPPPDTAMLPIDTVETIPGGASFQLGPLFAVGNAPSTLHVVDPAGHGVPAYLRITTASSGAAVEVFTGADGTATALVPTEAADVLIVPSVAGVAPHMFRSVLGTTSFVLDAATITGSVVDASGAPVAGAKVQITGDGVPSSLATTAASGSFTVWSDAAPGQAAVIDVAPPAGSGLPRLSASSAGVLALDKPLRIAFGVNLVAPDLVGLVVARDGAPLAGARVTVVGDSGAGGTITPVRTGTSPVVATGAVVVAATTTAAGALPHTRVPSGALSAVIAAGGDDFAVVALDTAHAPASLDAPAPVVVPSVITVGGAPVAGAVVDFLPTGALAQVAAPSVQAIAGSGANAGQVSARLAVGGHYDVRIHDPAGVGALTVLPDVEATALPPALALAPAIKLRGSVLFTGPGSASAAPLAGAAVQILCTGCVGLAADRPLAEGTTDLAGRFQLPIPDPNAASPAAAR